MCGRIFCPHLAAERWNERESCATEIAGEELNVVIIGLCPGVDEEIKEPVKCLS